MWIAGVFLAYLKVLYLLFLPCIQIETKQVQGCFCVAVGETIILVRVYACISFRSDFILEESFEKVNFVLVFTVWSII